MRTRRIGSRWAARGAVAVLAIGAFLVDIEDLANLPSVPSAEAQYGTSRRVARRTSRRTSRRQAAIYSDAYATSPPPGCSPGTTCGGATPAMQGDTVVYVVQAGGSDE